ncbi:DUF2254 domain-containing protein [Filobacillus milosensis]|uniref:DUF2254 domain-containing protein n=1 Tax=Filobacillus milosensis TaxID=94137 RepID=UPI001891EE48|nr:DUF2254 domain-containing protein [Filobacillus milosensis]
MIKKFILKFKESVWVIPVAICLFATLLTILVILIDYGYLEEIHDWIPEVLFTNAELGKDILGVIAGALLTMTTITFSTIMIVLTTYSSQFSPRTLQNFITDKRTLTVLGVFMGGFLYSIISLLFLHIEHPSEDILSAAFSVALSLICLGFFAFFIQHVATFIQVSNLITSITEEANRNLYKFHKKVEESDYIVEDEEVQIPSDYEYVSKLVSPSYGYLQIIDYEILLDLAREHDFIVGVTNEIGAFVVETSVIAKVYKKEEKELPKDIQEAFTIGNERNASEDVQYTIQKLEEIALRAISSGINDPHTAIDCIQHLGKILLLISKYHKEHLVYKDINLPRVITKQRQLRDIFYQSFYQVIDCMDEDVSILFVTMDTLILIGEESDEIVRSIIRELYLYLKANFDISQLKPLDCRYFDEKEQRLMQI